jgi:hypothetical protein
MLSTAEPVLQLGQPLQVRVSDLESRFQYFATKGV